MIHLVYGIDTLHTSLIFIWAFPQTVALAQDCGRAIRCNLFNKSALHALLLKRISTAIPNASNISNGPQS